MELTLNDAELDAIADRVAQRLGDRAERKEPFDANEAAEALGVTHWSVRKLAEAGHLKRVPGIGRFLVTAESVRAFQRGEVQAPVGKKRRRRKAVKQPSEVTPTGEG